MKIHGSGTFIQALTQTHELAKKNDASMKLYLLMLVIYASATVLLPLITVYVIDTLVLVENYSQFVFLALLFFVVNIIKASLRALINIYTSKREFQYAKKLEGISMESFFNKKGEFYTKNKTGDMMEVIMDDNLQVAEFTYQVYRTIADIVNSLAIIAILIYLQWDLALILLVCLPFILIIQNNLEWKLDAHYCRYREEMAKENSLTEEFVSNAALIASHGIKAKCRRKYEDILKRLVEVYKKIIMLSDVSFGILECFVILTISIAVVYEGYHIFLGTATIGVLVAFIQYSDFLIEPGRTLAALRVQGNKLMPSLMRVKKIYDDENLSLEGITPQFHNYDIEFNNVNFSYPNEKTIFHNASIKMKSGRTHIIFGASGQGKTTMINLITRLWEPTDGTISIDGCPVGKIQIDYLRRHIALVSQDNLFFNETIKSNLMEKDNQYTDKELYSALRKAGIFKEIMEMPQKLDTELGDRGYTLSGGQRQRLAIARAILKDSPIVIFDEATSALDEKSEHIIKDTIKNLKGKTMIVITHRKSMMDIGDCIYEIRDNKILEIQ